METDAATATADRARNPRLLASHWVLRHAFDADAPVGGIRRIKARVVEERWNLAHNIF